MRILKRGSCGGSMTSPWPFPTGSPTMWLTVSAVAPGARRSPRDTERTAQLFSAPQLVPDVDHAWARVQRELGSWETDETDRHRPPVRVAPRRASLPRVSLRAGLAIGAVGALAVGTAAAATFSNILRRPTSLRCQ